jgi:hypothetical protein
MTIDPRQAAGASPQISGELIRHDERPSSGTLKSRPVCFGAAGQGNPVVRGLTSKEVRRHGIADTGQEDRIPDGR